MSFLGTSSSWPPVAPKYLYLAIHRKEPCDTRTELSPNRKNACAPLQLFRSSTISTTAARSRQHAQYKRRFWPVGCQYRRGNRIRHFATADRFKDASPSHSTRRKLRGSSQNTSQTNDIVDRCHARMREITLMLLLMPSISSPPHSCDGLANASSCLRCLTSLSERHIHCLHALASHCYTDSEAESRVMLPSVFHAYYVLARAQHKLTVRRRRGCTQMSVFHSACCAWSQV